MPSVTIAPYIKNQYFDDNGTPLAGGFLYTYYAGTSTNKATYTDATGDTAQTNPIVLDSAGRASIYLASGAYKFVLKDSDGNTIWTEDNVVASTVTTEVDTVDDLKALTTTTNIVRTLGYSSVNDGGGWWFYWDSDSSDSDDGGMVIQPDSLPATGRWIGFLPLDGQLDLKTYGAACDGTTDDITELQACDTYCAANNLIILISDNTYFATDPSLSSKVRLLPSCQLRWGSINPTLDVIIDGNDKTQHFNNTVDYIPILNFNEIYPEWFGETFASHPITTLAIANLASQGAKMVIGVSKVDVQSGDTCILIGGDNNAITRTDATDKLGTIASVQRDNSEEGYTIIYVNATATNNSISIGGLDTSHNAATDISFRTAANNTTLTGTKRMGINSDGGITMHSLKSGATQAAAGAAQYELWVTASHATLPDGVLMLGAAV